MGPTIEINTTYIASNFWQKAKNRKMCFAKLSAIGFGGKECSKDRRCDEKSINIDDQHW